MTLSKNFLPAHPFDNGELKCATRCSPRFRARRPMRQHLADYYATISPSISNWVGSNSRVARGLAEHTIVIYSSDQGLAVGGRHGLMGKQNLYEHVKPPLVIAGPGIPQGRSDALVYLFDLFPTICDLAGVAIPAAVEGKSLLPVLRRRDATCPRDAVRGVPRCAADDSRRALEVDQVQREGREKNVQLFDLKTDPDGNGIIWPASRGLPASASGLRSCYWRRGRSSAIRWILRTWGRGSERTTLVAAKRIPTPPPTDPAHRTAASAHREEFVQGQWSDASSVGDHGKRNCASHELLGEVRR